MGVEISSSGLGEILDKINAEALDLSSLAAPALQSGAKLILDKAKQNLQTPTLHHKGDAYFDKNSIESKTLYNSLKLSRPSVKAKIKYINVLTKDPAAHLVEFGHGGKAPAPAHPFLMPAFQSKRNECEEIMAQVLSEAIR